MISAWYSYQSESLKQKGTLASWIVVIGSFFVPLLLLISALAYPERQVKKYADPNVWSLIWHECWQSMAILLMPVGIVLIASLVIQVEAKNNTWKQLHALPLSFTSIFVSKFLIVVTMTLKCFVLFNAGVVCYGIIPPLFLHELKFPTFELPWSQIGNENFHFFVTCLPVVTLQFLVSMHFKNFIIPIGAGLCLWFASIMAANWQYGYLFPYSNSMLYFLKIAGRSNGLHSTQAWSLGWSGLFLVTGYVMYISKRDKG